MSDLSLDDINKLLAEEKQQRSGGSGTRGPKIDPTEVREIRVWQKLNHHMCLRSCEHRENPLNMSEGRACWNPNCVDPRPLTDRGANIVALVKGQYVCRYCFLDGYLK